MLVISGLFFPNYAKRARPLFLRAVFQILFRISQSYGRKEIEKQICRRRILRSIANPKSGF